MPRQTEPNANNALGGLLQDMLPRGQVRSENTQAITGQPALRPDIIITVPGRSPSIRISCRLLTWLYDARSDGVSQVGADADTPAQGSQRWCIRHAMQELLYRPSERSQRRGQVCSSLACRNHQLSWEVYGLEAGLAPLTY